MISTFSRPTVLRLSATKRAARCTSPACSGSVLTLGMRRNSFSSSRRRVLFCSMKASVAWDTHYYKVRALSTLRWPGEPRGPCKSQRDEIYGLVELFLPESATAAPTPPPTTTAPIATFAPVDMPPPPALGNGGLGVPGLGGAFGTPGTLATVVWA